MIPHIPQPIYQYNTVLIMIVTTNCITVKGLLFIGTNLRSFYKHALFLVFLNSWFHTLQATINGKIFVGFLFS